MGGRLPSPFTRTADADATQAMSKDHTAPAQPKIVIRGMTYYKSQSAEETEKDDNSE